MLDVGIKKTHTLLEFYEMKKLSSLCLLLSFFTYTLASAELPDHKTVTPETEFMGQNRSLPTYLPKTNDTVHPEYVDNTWHINQMCEIQLGTACYPTLAILKSLLLAGVVTPLVAKAWPGYTTMSRGKQMGVTIALLSFSTMVSLGGIYLGVPQMSLILTVATIGGWSLIGARRKHRLYQMVRVFTQ